MSYPKSEMKCENCRCWLKDDSNKEEKFGYCKRYPPTNLEPVQTHASDWCFEFFPNYESKDYTY